MEAPPSPVDAYIRQLMGKERPKICFIPTPSGDSLEHIESFYDAYDRSVCEPSHLAFFRKPAPGSAKLSAFEAHVLEQDAIFVGGGSTKSALGVWREWGLDRVFKRAYHANVLLSGMSAGAMCWFESGLTDSYWGAGYQPLECLGFLQGGCGVHYHADLERQQRLREAIESGAIPASVAIDDFAAVLYENEKISRSIRWAKNSGAFTVSLSKGQATEARHTCDDIRVDV